MRILVVRPEPGASATAARVRALGHAPIPLPLLATQALAWQPPGAPPDAVILTSAAAVRHAGEQADALKLLPALCVGEATAVAARNSGWLQAEAGPGTLQALLDAAAAGPHRRLLYLAGEDRTEVHVPPTLMITTIIVYRARLLPLPMVPPVDAILLHSPRTARHLASEWDRLGGRRGDVELFAISEITLASAGGGWRASHAAAQPSEDALLAMLPKAL